jgi:4-carboxymuconolactone decarboxylase
MKKPLDEARQAYLQIMEEKRGYILDFHKILAAEDFEFLKCFNSLLQTAYLNPDTSADSKTKELILIAILIAVRSPAGHIKTHIQVAKRLGATKKEILEVLEMCLPPACRPLCMGSTSGEMFLRFD